MGCDSGERKMTASLEFSYRPRGARVAGLLTVFAVCLTGLVCLGYLIYTGAISWMGWSRASVSVVFLAAAALVLIPFYLFASRGVIRLTDTGLSATWLAMPPTPCLATLPVREIKKIDIQQIGKSRVMQLNANGGYSAAIWENMLPNAQAFDQLHRAILACRTDWNQTGTVWSIIAEPPATR
jgi:hypothetical protein